MSRKNKRFPEFDPLPVSAADLGIPKPNDGRAYRLETREERQRRVGLEWVRNRERTDARTDKRVAEAVDWHFCCIPGCNERIRAERPKDRPEPPFLKDVSQVLPMCRRHETIVVNHAMPAMWSETYQEVRHKLARQWVEKSDDIHRVAQCLDENAGSDVGQIYFVRINDMIKVGWSSRLESRLKSYGASAEILCHYPGSRQDETTLHRQLRPFLARGREWYQDCDLLADVVRDSIRRHGEPTIKPFWSKPKRGLDAKPKGWAS